MYSKFVKRIFDILIALVALPFVCLVIILVGPVIYLQDKGPIFYTAERRGKNGKTFTMYKFRSMIVEAPNIKNKDGSSYNGENDYRVTKIGKIMRKMSVDELPQFINVLKGEMSLIGPRPTFAIRPLEEFDKNYIKRFDVRPGITGYSQAYYRNSITQDEKFKYDCYYVENLSFAMDAKIFFATIANVIKRKNVFVDQSNKDIKEKVK